MSVKAHLSSSPLSIGITFNRDEHEPKDLDCSRADTCPDRGKAAPASMHVSSPS